MASFIFRPEDSIRCRLGTVGLDATPPCHVLSNTWDYRVPDESIGVNTHTAKVRTTLFVALDGFNEIIAWKIFVGRCFVRQSGGRVGKERAVSITIKSTGWLNLSTYSYHCLPGSWLSWKKFFACVSLKDTWRWTVD